jgi:hypothetical protein
MKVKAKLPHDKFGFYGGVRRYNGDQFALTDAKHFSEKWMVKEDAKSPLSMKSKEGGAE